MRLVRGSVRVSFGATEMRGRSVGCGLREEGGTELGGDDGGTGGKG